MAEQTTRVFLDELVPGMVLAENAVHLNGRVLLSAGSCLTEKHIKVFKTWGLTEAVIRGGGEADGNDTAEKIDPALLQRAHKHMEARFIHLDMQLEPATELLRICSEYYAKRLAAEGEHRGHNS